MKAFIVNKNRLLSLQGMIQWLHDYHVDVHILDNASTYPPLLEWYDRNRQITITKLTNDYGPRAGWELGLFATISDEHFIVTDADLNLDGIPHDWLDILCQGIEIGNVPKCGFSLEIEDIPDHFPFKQGVIDWEKQFWQDRAGPYFRAAVDTTFALYRTDRCRQWPGIDAVRADRPYVAKHLPWYVNPSKLSDEEHYFIVHAGSISTYAAHMRHYLGISLPHEWEQINQNATFQQQMQKNIKIDTSGKYSFGLQMQINNQDLAIKDTSHHLGLTKRRLNQISNVAIVFDDRIRPDTTGTYCLRALRQLVNVTHFQPDQMESLPTDFDLYINIDDGLNYELNPHVGPWVLWAIDTHIQPDRILCRAAGAAFVLAAQRAGVNLFRENNIKCLGWLPLAADPDVHKPYSLPKRYDACFVGHLNSPQRIQFSKIIAQHFPSSFIGQRFFDQMAHIYSESKIVTNLSVADDLNMRIFEALACGSFLMTNNLPELEQNVLFKNAQHLVTFDTIEDFIEKARFYMQHEDLRQSIASAGRNVVLAEHTYRHRMLTLLESVHQEMNKRATINSMQPDIYSNESTEAHTERTSIVIVTYNQLAHTQNCLQSIRERTHIPYELIFVDNGSTDGTADYLAAQTDIHLIKNKENNGFPAAANQGISAANGKYILLLNNDVVVTTGWLERMVAFLHNHPQTGLVGPVSNNVSGVQKIMTSYSSLDELEAFAVSYTQKTAGQVEYVNRLVGFCLLFRRNLVKEIGLLDERFGIGNFEDDDYCRRAIQRGYRAAIVKDSFVHHVGSASFSGNGIDIQGLLIRNHQKYVEKWSAKQVQTISNAFEQPKLCGNTESKSKLSLCMIVRDSARTLEPCLRSIRPWVDEMIVVDTGSTDQTKDIAQSLGARVFDFPWCDSFAAARNESLRHATGEWIFWMDADDTIDETNGRKLRELVDREIDPLVMGFVAQVHCPGPHDATVSVDHIKLIRRHADIRFSGRIHEQVLGSIRKLGCKVEWTNLFVTHSGSDQSPEGRAHKHARDIRLLRLELQDEPDSTFTLFNLGMTLVDMNDYENALSPLCRSLQMASTGDSHLRKIYALLVQAYVGLGRIETALRTSLQGLAVCPDDPELLFRLGTLYQGTGQLDEAVKAFQRVLRLPQQCQFMSVDREIFDTKSWHNLALVYEQQGNKTSAINAWRNILSQKPAHRPAWWSIISLCHGPEYRHILESVFSQLPVDKHFYDIQLALKAEKALGANDTELALSCFRKAQQDGFLTPELLEFACQVAFETEQLLAAREWLEALTKCMPDNPSALHNLATVYMKQQDYQRAEMAIQKALKIRPAYPPSLAILQAIQRSEVVQTVEESC